MHPAHYTILIPARLASSRLPRKPLADIGGLPMIVRVAQRVSHSPGVDVVVAADDVRIVQACAAHGVRAVLTDSHHASGSDRLAQASQLLNLPDEHIIVNVQGDEPLIDPALPAAVAAALAARPEAQMATAAHPLHSADDLFNPNIVKVVCDAQALALYFSRAPIPWWRDGYHYPHESQSRQDMDADSAPSVLPAHAMPLRHIGIYAYRAAALRQFPQLAPAPIEQCEALEQLRALWHGWRIAVHTTEQAPGPGVDTPEDLERVRLLVQQSA